MNQVAIKKRYDALQPLPDTGWDTTWVDRLRTFADFMENGQTTAALLRKLKRISKTTYESDFRGLAPDLHDLVLDVFPETPEEKADLEDFI